MGGPLRVELAYLAIGFGAGIAVSVVSLLFNRRAMKLSVPEPGYRWITPTVAEVSLPTGCGGVFSIRGVEARYGALQPMKHSFAAVTGAAPIEHHGGKAKKLTYEEGVDSLLIEPTLQWNVLRILVVNNRVPTIMRWVTLTIAHKGH